MNREVNKERALSKYFNLYMLISHSGWLWETLYVFFLSGEVTDRGFLRLPFCPIYATVIFGMYFLLGTITERRGILRRIKSETSCILVYLSFSFFIPTFAELVIGTFFNNFFNIRLWDYSYAKYNTGGYISLEKSLLWSAAIFLFMNKFFLPIKRRIFKISGLRSCIISVFLATIILIDLVLMLL